MTTIELSKTSEKLLKRIVESRLGSGSGSGLSLMCECTTEQIPKAKLTNEQYVALLQQISKIHKELDQMSAMIGEIEVDRQSKHDNSNGELFANCDDLYQLGKVIDFGRQQINEMRDMIRDVME